MTDRHEAALRAALAERDRLQREECHGVTPLTTNHVVGRIVEAALAAADAHDGASGPLLCDNCGKPMSGHTALAHCREAGDG